MTIWKYPLKIQSEQTIEAPIGFVPLSVQMQGNTPTLWALIHNEHDPRGIFPILMVGTGWQFDLPTTSDLFLGTVQHDGFVWHYFLMGFKAEEK